MADTEYVQTREMICISCPIGCRLTAEWKEDRTPAGGGPGAITVIGNRCNRGEEYAREETLAPKRTVTATCDIDSRLIGRLPIKTDAPLPKEHIRALLIELYRISVHPPINAGDVLIENIEGTGVNVVATRSVRE